MKLLLVDDHALFRSGMTLLLGMLAAEVHVDEAGNCDQAAARAGKHDYDLILVDLKMPGLNGLDAVSAMLRSYPSSLVVVLSGEDDPRIVREAIECGAVGFIPKSSTKEVMIQALKLVLARGVYLPHQALGKLGEIETLGFTDRQLEVLRYVVRGQTNKEIARTLSISEGTVKFHLKYVFEKLSCSNRTETVMAAAKLGLRLG
jgi:DNA-binding NarL/FixJ family response regulator